MSQGNVLEGTLITMLSDEPVNDGLRTGRQQIEQNFRESKPSLVFLLMVQ